MVDETELHREAYRVVMRAIPGSVYLAHEVNLEAGWDVAEIYMPRPVIPRPLDGCKTCGDPVDVKGLTHKCRDWHEVCQCGERYDQPKAKGCRRRKHPKEEK